MLVFLGGRGSGGIGYFGEYVGNSGGVLEMERDYESRSRVIVSVEQMISKVFKLLIKCENSQLIMKKELLYYIECDTIV